MQWFETDRVNLYVRKPATLGKAYQLFCNGFVATSLITDIRVMEGILREVKFKSAHFVFEAKVRLPQIRIDLFDETHGIKILVGDRTHPNCFEVIASYMNWAERFELAIDRITKFLEPEKRPGVKHDFEDWYVR